MTTDTQHIEEARRLGRAAGIAAGSWAVDGNTTADHARRVLAMLDAGDPMAYDLLPREPNLSGEYADDPSPATVYEQVTGRNPYEPFDEERNAATDLMEAICDAWEEAAREAFIDEATRGLRVYADTES